ncbi:hypothetical protein SRHO_G00098550 [Serrasalmus rhombeus]
MSLSRGLVFGCRLSAVVCISDVAWALSLYWSCCVSLPAAVCCGHCLLWLLAEIDAVLELGAKHLTWGCGILFTFPVVWSTLGVIEMCGTDMCGL